MDEDGGGAQDLDRLRARLMQDNFIHQQHMSRGYDGDDIEPFDYLAPYLRVTVRVAVPLAPSLASSKNASQTVLDASRG